MHSKNIHQKPYNFKALIAAYPKLEAFVFKNAHEQFTIDFSIPEAVFALNKALLIKDYGLIDWQLPKGYLCPPIPGRAEYIHHIADLLGEMSTKKNIRGLDIGTGANCIYPILGAQIYNFKMVGCDIDLQAIDYANLNLKLNPELSKNIEFRHQNDPANLFKGIVQAHEYFDFSICNPPFYSSAKEALNESKRKQKNLGATSNFKRNFAGEAHELWCNGGEALFIKRMIKQSVNYKSQVGVFTSLVSKSEHLPKIKKQLLKLKASYKIIDMEIGDKKSRILTWKF